jgi:hypothetical protein
MKIVADISLADAARAFARLAPENDETAQAIACLLGFDLPSARATATTSDQLGRVISQREARHSTPDRTDSELGDVLPTYISPEAATSSDFEISQVTSLHPRSAGWRNALPLDPFLPEIHLQGAAVYEPLFQPQWTRSIISFVLATDGPDGPLDVPQMVEIIASGKPVYQIPRLARPSLFRGAQVLVDVGEGMQPFLRDAEELQRQLVRIVGRSVLHSQVALQPKLVQGRSGTGRLINRPLQGRRY